MTLPLARPALYAAILIMVVRTLESFEVPAVVGLNNHIWVFTSRIWSRPRLRPARLRDGRCVRDVAARPDDDRRLLAQPPREAGARLPDGHRQGLPAAADRARRVEVACDGPHPRVLPRSPSCCRCSILFYASTQPFYSPPSRYTISHMSLGELHARLPRPARRARLQELDHPRRSAWRRSIMLLDGGRILDRRSDAAARALDDRQPRVPAADRPGPRARRRDPRDLPADAVAAGLRDALDPLHRVPDAVHARTGCATRRPRCSRSAASSRSRQR